MANEIEITVRVKDEASAQVAAIADKIRAAAQGASSGGSGEASGGSVQRFGREPGAAEAPPAYTDIAKVSVPVEPDDAGLKEKVKADVEAAGAGEKVKIPVEVDTGTSVEKLAAFDAAAKDADASGNGLTQDAAGRWRNALGQFATDAEKSAAGIDDAGSALDGAGKKADNAGKGANSGGNNFAFLYSKVGLLTEAALALGPALAAIPAVMGAVAVGGATIALGLGGVIKALQDYGAQSTATGQSSAQLAATAFSNSVAIRNAEQAITDAKRQAAIQQQNSADSVASAQEHLAQAQQSEQVATENLNQAWRDAVNVLADLNNSAADAVNGVADAQIALKQAQLSTAAVVASSLSTDDQKKAALQAVIDAQQHLLDAQQHAVEAQGAADDANARGVSGSTAVVSAQRAQAQAAQGVTDAQYAVVVAQRNAAQQQQASAEAIQKAVQNLSDTYEQQKLAAAAAASSGSAAANQFAKDMAGLTGPGRTFVDQLLSMKTGAKELAATAQTSMLPGLTTMLKDSSPMLPVFNGAIQTMGGVIGGLAIQFGKLMDSPAFRGQLTTVLHDGAIFAQQFGNGLVQMAGGLTTAAAKAGPLVNGLGLGFQTILGMGIPALFSGLSVNAGGAAQTIQGLLTIVSNLLGPLGTLAGSLSGAFGPFIQQLSNSLVPIMPQLSQFFVAFGQALSAVLQILIPLLPILSTGIVGTLKILAPLVSGLATAFQENQRWLTPVVGLLIAYWTYTKLAAIATTIFTAAMDVNPLVALATGLVAIVIGLVYLWDHFKGFRDFLKQMWADIKLVFFDFLHFVEKWWPELLAPFTGGVSEIIGNWGTIENFIKGMPAKLASAGEHMWDWIGQGVSAIAGGVSSGFHSFINELIQGINWAIGYVNGATKSISDAWTWIPGASGSGIPAIPGIPEWHAFGGVVGGLSAIIGDAGIEMTRLPNGSVVMPHANTQAALARGAQGGAGTLQIEWVGGSGGDELLAWIRKNIRIRGGSGPNSVQKVLGQTS